MRITNIQLKQLIKEEVATFFESNQAMDYSAELHKILQEITWWMEENGIYQPVKGIEAWLQHWPEHENKRQALLDMSDEIYEYMG
tara:strand:+ start:3078 stop:3332 length:255 start_codon:yes stop_codon:yes gene_type:complete